VWRQSWSVSRSSPAFFQAESARRWREEARKGEEGVEPNKFETGPLLLLLKLESRRYWVWICPEALRDFLALGGAVAGDGKDSHRAVGGGRGALAGRRTLSTEQGSQARRATPRPIVHYAPWMSPPATFLMWFRLRSPELAEDFERLMAGDRDIVRGSLDTVSDWRLTRPVDVPGQATSQADYVLIAEIVGVERWEQQASEQVQRLADDLEHLVSSRGMLVVRPVL
jgi:hypothetical protein